MTPEPLSKRMKRYADQLKEAGGHRLVADLDKDAHDALKTIMKRDGSTRKGATSAALVHFAKVKPKA